ncbi:hypothetical protein L7F22_040159 [Adiantum nelumboides]|nr:hypothetical protein [Adiantum nelumboides]
MFLQGKAKGSTWSDRHVVYSYDPQLGIWQEERVMAKQHKQLGASGAGLGASSYTLEKSSTLFGEKIVHLTCSCKMGKALQFHKLVGSNNACSPQFVVGRHSDNSSGDDDADSNDDDDLDHDDDGSNDDDDGSDGEDVVDHDDDGSNDDDDGSDGEDVVDHDDDGSNDDDDGSDGDDDVDHYVWEFMTEIDDTHAVQLPAISQDDDVNHYVWEFVTEIDDTHAVQLPAISQDTSINLVLVSSVQLTDFNRVGVSVTQMDSKIFHVELQNFNRCAFAIVSVAF